MRGPPLDGSRPHWCGSNFAAQSSALTGGTGVVDLNRAISRRKRDRGIALAVLVMPLIVGGPAAGGVFAFDVGTRPHPLIGKLYDGHHLADATFEAAPAPPSAGQTEPSVLASAVLCNDIVILGEVHDNPSHHRWRAWLVDQRSRLGAGRAMCATRTIEAASGAAVFEQIRSDQQTGLARFAALAADTGRPGTVGDLERLVDWSNSGWARYDYAPLLEAVIAARLPIYPGNPPQELIRAIAKGGLDALPSGERARLGPDVPLSASLQNALLAELEESHCGVMPRSAFGGLAIAQHYRDAHLAAATLDAAAAHGTAILFAGNGHARTDRGVPWHIHLRAPGKSVVSVQLLEVEDGKADPADYMPRDPDGRPAADIVIFTPRADRPDPCEEMRKRFDKRRE